MCVCVEDAYGTHANKHAYSVIMHMYREKGKRGTERKRSKKKCREMEEQDIILYYIYNHKYMHIYMFTIIIQYI